MTKQLQSLMAAVLTLVLAVGGFGSVASAQNVYGSAAIDATVDANVDTVLDDNSGSGSDSTSDSDSSSDDGTADQGSGDVGATVQAGASLRLDRNDARVESSTAEAAAPASVNSESDLEAFAAATLRSNDSVDDVDVSADHVTLAFKEDARLFGFIPVSMRTRVMVDAEGNVRLIRPWYSFLAVRASERTSEEFQARVEAVIENARTADGKLSARGQAVLMQELSLVLSGDTGARTSADASADALLDASASSDDGTPDQGPGDVAPQ